MQIKISGKHLELTTANEEYAEKKLERLTRYFDRIQQVDVVIEKVKNVYCVEIIIDVEKHEPFIATSDHENLYACIDLGVDRSVRQCLHEDL